MKAIGTIVGGVLLFWATVLHSSGCRYTEAGAAFDRGREGVLPCTNVSEGVGDAAGAVDCGAVDARAVSSVRVCGAYEGAVPVCEAGLSLAEFCPEIEELDSADGGHRRLPPVMEGRSGRTPSLCGRTTCSPSGRVPSGDEAVVIELGEHVTADVAAFREIEASLDDLMDVGACLEERFGAGQGGAVAGGEVGFRACLVGGRMLRACALTRESAEDSCIRRALGCFAAGVLPADAPCVGFQRRYRLCFWHEDAIGGSCAEGE